MTIAPQPAMPVVQTTTRRPQPRLAAAAASGPRRRVLSPVPQVRTGRALARLAALVIATTLCVGIVVSVALATLSGMLSQLGD